MHVFASRRLPGGALDLIKGGITVDVWPEPGPPDKAVIMEGIAGADGLVCVWTDEIDDALMAAGPGLKVISQMAVGVDNIDLAAATRRGIPVGNTPGVLVDTTAEVAWTLILATAHRITEAERYLRDGRWTRETTSLELLLGRDVYGSTLGIVGMGPIGQAVAARARGFDMRILYSSRGRKEVAGAEQVDLDYLLRESDVVTIHTALTEETKGMIGSRELSLMKPTAYLINTARGPVVDEAALIEALSSGQIAGAGIDVFETEPLPMDSPLLQLQNVVLVPHIGSATVTTRSKMATLCVENLMAGLRGERLPNCANPEVYE